MAKQINSGLHVAKIHTSQKALSPQQITNVLLKIRLGNSRVLRYRFNKTSEVLNIL